jgi:E3 ubiquitin-protein ligase HUWE1
MCVLLRIIDSPLRSESRHVDISFVLENKWDNWIVCAVFALYDAYLQIDAFLEGFHQCVPSDAISIFDPTELELLISGKCFNFGFSLFVGVALTIMHFFALGCPDIYIEDLRRNTTYQGYTASDPTIAAFWKVLHSLAKEEQALFIQFVTGSSKVPLDGFKALQVRKR